MSFPNTAYKPGDEVWYLEDMVGNDGQIERYACQSQIMQVIWANDYIVYTINGRGYEDTFDMDDLYPSEAAALNALKKGV